MYSPIAVNDIHVKFSILLRMAIQLAAVTASQRFPTAQWFIELATGPPKAPNINKKLYILGTRKTKHIL